MLLYLRACVFILWMINPLVNLVDVSFVLAQEVQFDGNGDSQRRDLRIIRNKRTHGHSAVSREILDRHGSRGPTGQEGNSRHDPNDLKRNVEGQHRYRTGGGLRINNYDSQSSPNLHRQGFLTYHECPYRCEQAGLNRDMCKDYRREGWCVVEDLGKPRQTNFVLPRRNQGGAPMQQTRLTGGSIPYSPRQEAASEMLRRCQSKRFIPAPLVNISKVKSTGSIFRSRLKVFGSVEGVCLTNAGVFQNNSPKSVINVVTRDRFDRFNFKVIVDGDEEPQVRVYNVQGNYDIVPIISE